MATVLTAAGPRSAALGILAALFVTGAFAADYDPWTETARYEFTYRVDVTNLGRDGARTRLWLPHAARTPSQKILDWEIFAPTPYQVSLDAYGNRIVYMEWQGPAPGDELWMRFVVERAVSHGIPKATAVRASGLAPGRYLGAQKKIPLDGMIATLAVQEAKGKQGDDEKIRAYYDYVVRNLKYSKRGEGWGQGDAIWACTAKYGNCTDFHSLFIGMARSQGIPARFVIGFPMPTTSAEAKVDGYHCWSEAWAADFGWKPLDASEAWKSKRFDDYFGRLPSDRIEFSVGRDLVLTPKQDGEPLNYFIYPYAEVDGVPVEKVPASFHMKRLEPAAMAMNEEAP